jgi:hypothetical protein
LPQRPCRLQQPVKRHEQPRGHDALEQADSKVRDSAQRLYLQPNLGQPLPHPGRMEVEIQFYELHRLPIERRPALPPHQVAQDRLQVALVGELQHERATGRKDAGHAL